jgi:sugar phosphate isomerase/epimerase
MNNKIGVVTSFIKLSKFGMEEVLAGISTAGFKYVELSSNFLFLDKDIPGEEPNKQIIDNESIKKALDICKKYYIKIYALSGHDHLMKKNAVYNMKKVIDLAKLLDVKYITTDAGNVYSKNEEKKALNDLIMIADYAMEKKIIICLETLGNWINTGVKAERLMEQLNHPNIKINYDIGNVIFYADQKPEEDIKSALPLIAFIHLKDKISIKNGKGIWDFPALGDGNIDYNSIFKILQENNYSGPMSVEIKFDGKEHPLEEINTALRRSYIFLKGYGYLLN